MGKYATINPATGEVVQGFDTISDADADRALTRAHEAYLDWRNIELKERAAKSFKRLGMEGVSVEASTFHALGLRIIGKATGEKPDIPDMLLPCRSRREGGARGGTRNHAQLQV